MKVNKQKLLLLVEDNVLIATSGQIDLEQYGYKIILAHSGEEAVELFKTNPNIDLIIMDIDLGKGIDGIEAAEIILREREIPILFLSSHIEPEIVEKTENITSYGYVVKNSSITVLDASIKMAFKLFNAKMNELIKEKKLEKSEAKLRNIFENSTNLFYSHTPEHVITYLSPQVKDILGYTPEEAMIKWTELASDNPINEVGYNYTVKAIETGKPQPAYELELVKKDGTKIWVELREGPVVKNGKTVAIVGTLTDITDRKKAMTELQESEEKYRLLTESMKDVVIRISPAGKLLYVSPTIKEFGGYEPKEEIGNNISNYFYKKTDLLKALKLIADVVISHKSGSFEFMFKPKGKDPFFVEHTYVPLINDNKVYEIQLVLRNISDRKKIERQLQKSEENLRITLTSIGDAVISTDINGQVVQMNPIAEQLTGWTIKEAKGELLLDVFHIINTKTRKMVDNPAEKVLKSGQIVGLANHTMLISKDGTEYQIADSGAPIKDNQGNITGVVLVFRDVTEEYKMQEDLKRSEQYFKTLIENSSDVISILDKTGAVTYESPSHKRILGYDTDFLIEKNIFALVHPDDRERILHQFVELLPKPGNVEQVSFRFLHKNGNWLNLEGIANNLLHSPIINGIVINYHDVTDRVLDKEALIKKNEQLELVMSGANIGWWDWDIKTGKEVYNDILPELLGYELNEIVPHIEWWGDKIHPDDQDKVNKDIQRHFNGETEYYTNNHRLKTKSGKWKWFYDHGKVVSRDKEGKPVRMLGTLRVIDKQIQAEQKLIESKQYFETLIDNNIDAISILDINGNNVFQSKSVQKLLGYTKESRIGKSAFDFMHPDDKKQLADIFKQIIKIPDIIRNINFRIIHNDDSIRYFEGTAKNLLHSPIIKGIIVNYRDVTDRKKAEEKLYESENNLRLLFNAMEDIVLEMDDNGKYIYIAPTSSELYYKPAEEAIGKTLHELFPKHQADFFLSNIKKSLKENETVKIEYELEIKNKTIYFEGRFAPKSNNTVLYIASNITERKQAEEKVKNLLKEKEILLKEVHHRTKNNMTVIKSLLSMQIRSLKIPEDVSIFQDAISRIESMIKLYDKLYKTENYEEVTIKTYLYSLIDEIIQLFPNWKSIQINTQIEDFAIETKLIFPLGIILTELLTNTMKYAFPNKKDGKIDVNISKKQNHVTFIYKDNGIGIIDNKKEEQKPGFGLNLIKLLSKQINGSVINTNDNGVKFIIEFDI